MPRLLKDFLKKFYIVLLMVYAVWYGYFIYPIIFAHWVHDKEAVAMDEAATEEEKMFQKFLQEQGETSTTNLGYRIVKEQYVKGHFHHIGMTIDPDNTNVCIMCHGDVPHDKAKEIRAFLNMHAFYLACETCHVKEKEDIPELAYRWYDKKTGELISNPPTLLEPDKDKYGNYGAKIAPGTLENGIFTFVNGEKEAEFVEEYLQKKDMLGSTQQSKMKKVIHRLVDEKPLLCDACHTKDEPFLDYAALGYPPRRIGDLTSTEVVGMIEKYKKFYIPKFLMPGVGDEGEEESQEEHVGLGF